MAPSALRNLAIAIGLSCASALSQACYVDAPPVAYGGYEPAFYDGYVVYYDGIGRPFYYGPGGTVWISPRSPYYAGLAGHWHTYGPAYGGWYAHGGYRYHSYHGVSHGVRR